MLFLICVTIAVSGRITVLRTPASCRAKLVDTERLRAPDYPRGTTGADDYRYHDDYMYWRDTDAFYKLHTEEATAAWAQLMCETEGAALLAAGGAELVAAHALLKRAPDARVVHVATGEGKLFPERDQDGEYTEYDDKEDGARKPDRGPRCNVLSMRGKTSLSSMPCSTRLPFLCRVARADLHYNEQCQLYDPEYQYNATLGSCYKFKMTPLSWGQSLAECQHEGAHLVVLNSVEEARYVQSKARGRRVSGATRSEGYFWHIGIRSHPETDQTLAEAGYADWSNGEPNNYRGTEHCGSLFVNTGQLNDIDCDHLHGFVCEKEIH